MTEVLATRVTRLTGVGWELKAATETSAELEARRPFNWQLFALMFALFPVFGGLIYAAFWALTPNAHLLLSEQDGQVMTSGGTPLTTRRGRDIELARRVEADLRPRGRLAALASSLIAMTLVVLVWVFVVWSVGQAAL